MCVFKVKVVVDMFVQEFFKKNPNLWSVSSFLN